MLRGRVLLGLSIAAAIVVAMAAGYAAASAKRTRPVLRVVPKLAPAKKASATIGAQGGRLHVKTPSGTSVTLVIPAGALAENTQVTLTPIAALKRIPFKRGIAGAVQLRPEGLVLAKPARLLFRPRKRVPTRLQTPFSATGTGGSFHIYPGKTGRVMLVPIMHFSIYGEGEATRQERVGEAGRQQSSPQAAVERDMAAQQSTQQLANDFASLAERAAGEVSAALSEDALVSRALDDALTLAEELRLAGWSSDVLPDMGDQLPASVDPRLRQLIEQIRASFPAQILENALARALDRCASDHSQAARDSVLSIMETERQLGVTDEIDLSLLDRCSGYQLEITSNRSGSLDITGPAPLYEHETGSYQFGLHSLVSFDAANGGSGSLSWTSFSYHWQEYFPNGSGQCVGTGPETDTVDGQSPQPGSVVVQQMSETPDISLSLSIAPASYDSHSTDTNGCGSNSTNDSTSTTDGGFGAAPSGVTPEGQNAAGASAYKITGWTPGASGSGVIATKTITLSDGTITLKITSS